MNYLRHYVNMMRMAQGRVEMSGYTEKHHVFPRSIFGDSDYVVVLSAREHFVAHFLLWKICKSRYGEQHWRTRKMAFAFNQMTWNHTGKRHVSRSFQYARAAMALAVRGSKMCLEGRMKISASKTGKPRPDMRGKSYMGASQEKIEEIRSKSRRPRGKINYPESRKSAGPCPDDKRHKISESRKKTMTKFAYMDEKDFQDWLSSVKLFAKDGRRRNSNVCAALIARGRSVDEFYSRFE